jgi:hypothetical protein
MPYLRFTRDRRGYENTYVMHTSRRRGKARSSVLYWFRSPPDVKVGRAALDEDAIRLIEDSNPDITFDWDQILATRPGGGGAPPLREVPEREPAPGSRGRRDRDRRRSAQVMERPTAALGAKQGSVEPAPPEEPIVESTPPSDEESFEAAEIPETVLAEVVADEAGEQIDLPPVTPARPVEQLLDPEALNRMRGRHAELLARISQQVTDPAQRELLRSEAERLNPDVWVTADEVRQGLDQFEAAFEAIRSRLPRRRRRRRGGRRRHVQQGQQTGTEHDETKNE